MCQDNARTGGYETNTAVMPVDDDYRLSGDVRPLRYEIHLRPDLTSFVFSGSEKIEVEITRATDLIVMNALDLSVQTATLRTPGGGEALLDVRLDTTLERLELKAEKTLAPGKYFIDLEFKGEINDKLRGFYRSAQLAADLADDKKWIGLTQFEATDARRAFPCFDEPSLKAVFQLTLTVKDDLMAISNTPVASESRENGLKTVVFEETMKMSTYIVAFVIGHFDVSEAVMVDGVPMRIYAPLGKLHLTDFALEIGASALSFFNHYYGIPYPGKKMDMIAVPDFAFGAMENLGAVIYRENALLVDPEKASHAELERVADVVAHELAHMWFGNLTTMKWWNGIWLNEAFATFMELVAVENYKPEWKRWETFGVSRAAAMATDGLSATRKIEFPVVRPEEANGMFDVLTYEKGASVLRMLEQYIGEDKFKSGVNAYLHKHKFSNTETHDLWNALSGASSEPVREIMDSWIFQEGYPMISVELADGGRGLTLKQRRFFYLSESAQDNKGEIDRGENNKSEIHKSETVFKIPVLLRLSSGGRTLHKKVLLDSAMVTLSPADLGLSGSDGIESVLVNSGGHGFYRVHYSSELAARLHQALSASFKTEGHEPASTGSTTFRLSTLERFNLVSDMFAMTVQGSVKTADFFQFLRLFAGEPDKNVWSIILASLQYIDRLFAGKNIGLPALVQEIAGPNFDCLGFDASAGEDEQVRQLRGIVLTMLGTLADNKKIQSEAAARYAACRGAESAKAASKSTELSPDVMQAIVGILAHCGDAARYEEFSRDFEAAVSPQDKDRYMYALAQFADAALLEKTLQKTLSGVVRSQNAPYLVRNVMLNPRGREVGWHFVRDNWKEIRKLFPSLIITRLVEGVTGLNEPAIADEVFAFFEKHKVKEGQKTVDQHLEKLKVALAYIARES